MYGLLLRALQGYICTTFGARRWVQVMEENHHRAEGFEPLLHYDLGQFRAVLARSCKVLGRSAASLLEDMGTFMVTNPAMPAPRRLLRFAGNSYGEFLLSLEELPERAKLALYDVCLPRIVVRALGAGEYLLYCKPAQPEVIHLLHGLLRAMADDYGTLVFIEFEERPIAGEGAQNQPALLIRMAEAAHAPANPFQLVVPL